MLEEGIYWLTISNCTFAILKYLEVVSSQKSAFRTGSVAVWGAPKIVSTARDMAKAEEMVAYTLITGGAVDRCGNTCNLFVSKRVRSDVAKSWTEGG
jgi:hypothetical protein